MREYYPGGRNNPPVKDILTSRVFVGYIFTCQRITSHGTGDLGKLILLSDQWVVGSCSCVRVEWSSLTDLHQTLPDQAHHAGIRKPLSPLSRNDGMENLRKNE